MTIGVCVLVDNVVVAWFSEFDDDAEQWCTENHFGRWVTWKAYAPKPIPLTEEECARIRAKSAELHSNLRIE